MMLSLALFSPTMVNPRFYRTHFLTVLGLGAGVAVLTAGNSVESAWGIYAVLALAFVGSMVWSLRGAPAGKTVIGLTAIALGVTLGLVRGADAAPFDVQGADATPLASRGAHAAPLALLLTDDLTSAVLLGTAITAMLMGHSYLIAPSMSLTPLMRLLAGLFVAVALRMLLAGLGLWFWTDGFSALRLEGDTVLWLPVRWIVGLAAPLALGWMARESARIRSTQSATGILYVVVIFCFLGELVGQLLYHNTGFIL
jgi:hypothetical protein